MEETWTGRKAAGSHEKADDRCNDPDGIDPIYPHVAHGTLLSLGPFFSSVPGKANGNGQGSMVKDDSRLFKVFLYQAVREDPRKRRAPSVAVSRGIGRRHCAGTRDLARHHELSARLCRRVQGNTRAPR
jgi:hypothetical protein